jgi:osmotically-inducible protein OsmY
MKTDGELRDDVMAELKWEPRVTSADVGVIVKNGVVTLIGSMDSYGEKLATEQAVQRVSGVMAVADELEVRIPGSSARTDADIAAAVANVLKSNHSVPNDRIKVVVERGWVALDGDVEWHFQRSSAVEAVHALRGVKGVLNHISVKPRVSPEDIKRKIEAAFERSAQIDAQKITVSANQGKVTLFGSVCSYAQRDQAATTAWSAPGVWDVVNHIVVMSPDVHLA